MSFQWRSGGFHSEGELLRVVLPSYATCTFTCLIRFSVSAVLDHLLGWLRTSDWTCLYKSLLCGYWCVLEGGVKTKPARSYWALEIIVDELLTP